MKQKTIFSILFVLCIASIQMAYAENLLPDKPKNLEAYPISPTSIIISWDAPEITGNVTAITGYKIEYKIDSGDFISITANSGSTSSSFIHQGLDSEIVYSYRVNSINSEGTSVPSSTVSLKPEHTTTPVALTATAISPSQIKLTWLAPSESILPIRGYEIKREINPGVFDSVGSTNKNTLSFIVSNLATDKTYSYVVSGTTEYGSTQESISASATPKEDSIDTTQEPISSTAVQETISTPPIKLTASVVSSTQINLSWSPPVEDGNTPITGYKIEVKSNDEPYSILIADTENTSKTFPHTDLITNTKYTYKVSAINKIGISESSNEFSATAKSTNVQISPLGKFTIDEGKFFSFTVKLVDNSMKNVVFSLDNNPPTGAKIISNTGMFSWTPSATEGGKTYTFHVIAKKDGLSDSQIITISVNDNMKDSQPAAEPEPAAEPKELGIASFVDETKDAQTYVDRYNNEASYKEWFDENYSEYDSIYHAVGLEEPTEEIVEESEIVEPEFGECGKGTELVGDTCVMIETTNGGGCLIATATYGSELAPQVQQLREIRDNQLLNTNSGESFMTGFNQFYYSFSPIIADMERENPVFREVVKIGITPLLSSLSILSFAESESEVIGYGIGVILMNIGMYFAVPAIVIFKARKYIKI